MIKRKRLFFDIETSPNQGYFWNAGYKQRIDYHNIEKERAIICICYKWEGDKKVYSLTWDDKQCDKTMLEKFAEIAEDAEELVGHNGDKFDLAWIRTRCMFHRIHITPFLKTIDTLKIARRLFRCNSNRLDYLGQFLGLGCKIKTGGFDLWKQCCDGNKKSLERMVTYCKGDVRLLERVFAVLYVYDKPKTHYGMKNGGHKCSCPECGSENLYISKQRMTAAGTPKTQLQCNDCGTYHTVPAKEIDKLKAA